MKVAIIDDEPLAVEVVKDYVDKTDALELIYAGSNVFELLKIIQNGAVDVVFLDIQMPELNGIQLMKIADSHCQFILTTAYTAYAIEGYEYNVVDYLLKPFSYERFLKAVDKLKRVREYKPQKSDKQFLKTTDYLFVKSEYKTLKINLSDVLYVKSLADYIEFHFLEQKKILSLDTLKNLKKRLPAETFIQIHRSYIVNVENIDYVERNRIIMPNRERLPIGESYRKDFFEKLF